MLIISGIVKKCKFATKSKLGNTKITINAYLDLNLDLFNLYVFHSLIADCSSDTKKKRDNCPLMSQCTNLNKTLRHKIKQLCPSGQIVQNIVPCNEIALHIHLLIANYNLSCHFKNIQAIQINTYLVERKNYPGCVTVFVMRTLKIINVPRFVFF